MRRFFVLLLLCCFLFCFGCQARKDCLHLLAGEFELTLTGTLREVELSATLCVTGRAQERALTLLFSAPEVLFGNEFTSLSVR